MTGTEEGLVKGKSAEEKRKPERIFSGHRVKSSVTVIQVDGELPKEQIREDAKPLEELTFKMCIRDRVKAGRKYKRQGSDTH